MPPALGLKAIIIYLSSEFKNEFSGSLFSSLLLRSAEKLKPCSVHTFLNDFQRKGIHIQCNSDRIDRCTLTNIIFIIWVVSADSLVFVYIWGQD